MSDAVFAFTLTAALTALVALLYWRLERPRLLRQIASRELEIERVRASHNQRCEERDRAQRELAIALQSRDEWQARAIEAQSRSEQWHTYATAQATIAAERERLNGQLQERLMALVEKVLAPPVPLMPVQFPTPHSPPSVPTFGPKTLSAINAFAGGDRELERFLAIQAQEILMTEPETTDEQLALRIMDGESGSISDAERDDDDTAAPIIPGQ